MTNAEEDMHTNSHGWLIDELLDGQRALTAVDLFSRKHTPQTTPPPGDKTYRDLIPLAAPAQGEQYAFEVDLDACSGCKACVTACHSLNGLEENETWRSVGMLQGGSPRLPVIQHVTTACHHCLDPACLTGCPVKAYEKDPVTGIVRHLDDQCIGCRYCMLMCPYDVPQYSSQKGIVRKCDMCHDRLTSGEAPACVQSCPNGAIRIRVVSQHSITEDSETNLFLPGAPEPGQTLPTTLYKTRRSLPRNLLPADYYSASPQHSHLPLVFMLVLTQMSVGAFVVEQALLATPLSNRAWIAAARPVHLLAALGLGLLGMMAAVLHLGRPRYAFRAVLGLKTSWLSREIAALGLFSLFAAIYASSAVGKWPAWILPHGAQQACGMAATLAGVAAVVCSVMVYAATGRPFWNLGATSLKFLLTALVLGLPASLLIGLIAGVWTEGESIRGVMADYGTLVCRWLIVLVTAKLLLEALIFGELRRKQRTPLKRTALLMTGELSATTLQRFFFGVVGGVVLPGVLLAEHGLAGEGGFSPLFVALVVTLLLVVLLVGELLERYLFFTAVVAPTMPGSPAS